MGTSPAASLCASLGDLPQRARDHSFSATEEPESGMNDNVTTEQPTPEQAIPEQPTPEGEAQRELIGWEPELLELRHRQALAREMGGPERVERQHKGGRLTVRERIDRLLDAGTFQEIGSIAGKAWYDAKGNITEFMPGKMFGSGTMTPIDYMVEMAEGRIDAETQQRFGQGVVDVAAGAAERRTGADAGA